MRKHFRILITTIILAASTLITVSYAATDLLQVYKSALMFDLTFQSARETYLAATEAYPQALALLLPNIGLTGEGDTQYEREYGTPAGFPSGSGNLSGYQYTLTLTQPVINFNDWWGLSSSSYTVKQAAATYAAAAQDLLLRTAQAYFNVLLAQDTLRFTNAEKMANKQQLEQAKQRFAVGLDAITSVYNAEASYDATIAQVIAAENQVENSKEQLSLITGVYFNNLATLKQQMPLLTPEPENIEAWVLKSELFNFQLQAARFAADAARENIKIAFAGHLPTINMVGSSQRTHFGDPSRIQSNSIDNRVDSLSLELNMPIFQGGLVSSQVRQQQDNYLNAIVQMENIKEQVNVNLRQTYNSIISGISKIRADVQAVISQQASVNSTAAALQVGTRTIVDLLQAQQQLYQAQTTLAQDQYTYINNTLTFKQLAGTLTYKDLQAINTWLQGNGSLKSPYNNRVCCKALLIAQKTTTSTLQNITTPPSMIASLPNKFQNKPVLANKPQSTSLLAKNVSKNISISPVSTTISQSNHTKSTIVTASTKNPVIQNIGKNYTIQLMARQNRQTISDYVQQHDLAKVTSIHQTQLDGQKWYALFYGTYPSIKAAHNAIAMLPNKLQDLSPWVRPLS